MIRRTVMKMKQETIECLSMFDITHGHHIFTTSKEQIILDNFLSELWFVDLGFTIKKLRPEARFEQKVQSALLQILQIILGVSSLV